MRRFIDLLGSVVMVLGVLFLMAQVPQFSQNLPANTVVGRLGVGPGPSQAIPFTTLVANLPLPIGGGTLPTTSTSIFVSPTGNDSNDCLSLGAPCLTISHAIDICNIGARCQINLAAGTYSTTTGFDIAYHRIITITGNCANHSDVVINIAGNGLVGFFIEDMAIGIVGCMTFTTTGNDNTVIAGRQLAIVDIGNIDIDGSSNPFVGGRLITATGNASVNCSGTILYKINVALTVFVNAQFNSTVTIACNIVLQVAGGSVTNALVANNKAVLDASSAVFSGVGSGNAIFGNKCSVTDSTLILPTSGGVASVPGANGTCSTAPAADAATGAGYIH